MLPITLTTAPSGSVLRGEFTYPTQKTHACVFLHYI
nr:MAG TPA: hypothetical protein [Caudoviricetes sp.]